MNQRLATWVDVSLTLALLVGSTGSWPAQAQPSPPGQKMVLRWFFWSGTGEERKFWEDLAADATRALPNTEVKFETDSFTNFWPKLETLAAAGQVPCIIGLQSLRTATFVSRGVYAPIDDLTKADRDVNLSDFNKGII
jgi:ABC-type glycerol-3-phosphate transport system substrate-binding protein